MQIEKREIVKCVLLSLITCGIYEIIWVIKLARDAVRVKDVNDNATAEILLMLFFPFVGCYLAEKKMSEGCVEKNVYHKDNSIVYLILGLFGFAIVSFCLMQSDLNKLVDMGINDMIAYQASYGAPQNPQYGAPQYGAPQNPQYGAPQNPPYGAPQNPQYGAPQNPQYGAPQNPPSDYPPQQ